MAAKGMVQPIRQAHMTTNEARRLHDIATAILKTMEGASTVTTKLVDNEPSRDVIGRILTSTTASSTDEGPHVQYDAMDVTRYGSTRIVSVDPSMPNSTPTTVEQLSASPSPETSSQPSRSTQGNKFKARARRWWKKAAEYAKTVVPIIAGMASLIGTILGLALA